MITICQHCGRVYDDAEFFTICPHDPLGGGNYCREHDLFNCYLNHNKKKIKKPRKSKRASH